MIVGNVLGWDSGGDDLFRVDSHRNRDDCLEPFRVLNQFALSSGVVLHTPDINKKLGLKPSFNLLLESVSATPNLKNYLIRFESEFIVPKNGDEKYLRQFDLVFTWQDDLVDNLKYIKICYPNKLSFSENFGFSNRPIFASMISGNKFVVKGDARELYSQRVNAIRWFEKNYPDSFHLYGQGWDKPPKSQGYINKFLYKTKRAYSKLTKSKPFPSYKGAVTAKRDVLEKSRFSICYENVRDLPGYITEKIFDCFFSGCIPVYWGATEIDRLVPQSCFIDKRNFSGMESLYHYLINMTEYEYIDRQKKIRDFLDGELFVPFSSEQFARTIVQSILKDIS